MANLPCKKSDVVFILWLDAQSEWTRHHIDAVDKLQLATNRNLGWIISEDENRIVFANGDSSSGEVDTLIIPRSCIIDIVPVSPQRKKKKPEPAPQPEAEKTDGH